MKKHLFQAGTAICPHQFGRITLYYKLAVIDYHHLAAELLRFFQQMGCV
jgi:hypothetical protein